MSDLFSSYTYLGLTITLAAYLFGVWLRKKTGRSWCNPLLVACVLVIALLLLTRGDYADYQKSANYVSYLLTPATVCLAIPLYRQLQQLRRNWKAILAGILSGAVASMALVLLLALAFELDHAQYVTLLPKSVTTAIGMELSSQAGGLTSISVAAIVLTGIIGSITAHPVCKLMGITHPVAVGVACGTSAHVIGTSKAMELGEVQGAISSLATVTAGLLTAVLFSVFTALV